MTTDAEIVAKLRGHHCKTWPDPKCNLDGLCQCALENKAADLIGRLQADLSDARKSTDFWKAEYLAGNGLIEQQATRIKELEKDAERYRWLRDTDTAVVAWIEEDGPRWSIEGRDGHKITRDELDAAIDAAMEADK